MRAVMLIIGLVLAMLAAPLCADAQRPPELRRIGYLDADVGGLPAGFYDILREGLRELGYLEGRNLVIEHRSTDSLDRLPELATELIRRKVEIIVAPGRAARGA